MSSSGQERRGAWLLHLIPRNSLAQNNPRSSPRSSSPTFPLRPSLELSMWSSLLPFSLLALVVSVQAQGQVPAVATPAALALVDAQYVASGLNTKTYVPSSLPTRVRHLVVCPPPDFDQSEELSADERIVVRGSESSCKARRSSLSFILLSQFRTANLTLQRVRPLSLLNHRTSLTTRGIEVAQLPTVYITPAAGALTTFTQTTKYTLVLADAASLGDPDLTAPTEGGDYRHFLANSLVGAPATGGNSTFVTSGGNVVTAYAGPGPLVGTGPHRYSWLLFAQAGNFVAPNGLNAMTPPSHWKYVSSLSFLSTSCPPELS